MGEPDRIETYDDCAKVDWNIWRGKVSVVNT